MVAAVRATAAAARARARARAKARAASPGHSSWRPSSQAAGRAICYQPPRPGLAGPRRRKGCSRCRNASTILLRAQGWVGVAAAVGATAILVHGEVRLTRHRALSTIQRLNASVRLRRRRRRRRGRQR
eukprot:scaffold76994_cov66-Phaeocystis_antarctica.AAC.3